NLLIGPLDAILAGLSTEAALLVQPDYQVTAAGNYYFIFVSTFLISIVGTLVTEKWVEPLLGKKHVAQNETLGALSAEDRKGLKAVGVFTLAYALILLFALLPDNAVLRNPESGSILHSPFISGIVLIIALYAAIAGYVFGRFSGHYEQPSRDMI
ncbi:MAG: AbgT family transporter, partial [Pseudomonadales bacterium]